MAAAGRPQRPPRALRVGRLGWLVGAVGQELSVRRRTFVCEVRRFEDDEDASALARVRAASTGSV